VDRLNGTMMKDRQGLEITTSSHETVALLDHFVGQVLSYGQESDCLCKKSDMIGDEEVLLHALIAICCLGAENKNPKYDACSKSSYHIQKAKAYQHKATKRERMYVSVCEELKRSNKEEAARIYEEIVDLFPRDILAAKLAQEQYFNMGESENLRRVGKKCFQSNQDVHFS